MITTIIAVCGPNYNGNKKGRARRPVLRQKRQKLHRTMQVKVCPSTVAVTLQVPLLTAVTVPLPSTEATPELEVLHTGVLSVPETRKRKLSPAL